MLRKRTRACRRSCGRRVSYGKTMVSANPITGSGTRQERLSGGCRTPVGTPCPRPAASTEAEQAGRRTRRRQLRTKQPARPHGSKAAGQPKRRKEADEIAVRQTQSTVLLPNRNKESPSGRRLRAGRKDLYGAATRISFSPDPVPPVRRATRTTGRPPKRRTAERGRESTHSPNRFRPCPGSGARHGRCAERGPAPD